MELSLLNKDKIAKNYVLKTIILGDHGVGKTSMIETFVQGYLSTNISATIGVAFSAKDVTINNDQMIRIQLWDTAGSERYKSITRSYMRNSNVAFIVFDRTNRESWSHINDWKKDLDIRKDDFDQLVVLVASKSDLKDK